MTEWALWLAGTGVFSVNERRYAWNVVASMDALTWRKAFFSETLLCKIVEMLHNVPITAAPTERSWSLRGAIHTKLRNRMKVDTASQVTFIKHNLTLEYADLFRKVRVEQQLEETETEIAEPIETNDEFGEFDGKTAIGYTLWLGTAVGYNCDWVQRLGTIAVGYNCGWVQRLGTV